MKRGIRSDHPVYKGVELDDKDIRAFRITNLIAGEYDKSLGAFEREICGLERQQREKANQQPSKNGWSIPPCIFRGMVATGTDQQGKFLVQDRNAPIAFAEFLYAQSVVIPRSTMLMDLQHNIAVSQEETGITPVWGTEISEAPESDPAYGAVSMSPHDLKCMTIVSRFLAGQSDPSAENLVRNSMMAAFAAEFDNKALYGTGTNSQISGLDQLSRIKDAPNTGRVTYQKSQNMTRKRLTPALPLIGKANATDMLTWLIGWDLTEKIQQTYGFIENGKMFGVEAVSSSSVAADDAWLGNFQYLISAFWGGFDIVLDKTTLMHTGQIRIVAHYRVDAQAVHDDAFVHVKGE